MAETEAKKRGWWVKVETRGSVGAGNAITPEEVAAADLVIVAADIEWIWRNLLVNRCIVPLPVWR